MSLFIEAAIVFARNHPRKLEQALIRNLALEAGRFHQEGN